MHVLRHKVLVEGLSRRQAAREMGISRNTVRRYLRLPEPLRVEREPRRKPVLERVQPRLDALLEEWSGRTTAKQRLTATRLHRQLREEGYEAGETLVRDYLREWRRRRAEVYVPLVHRPGDEAQADFFEVTVELRGERRKAWKFLMRLMYSGRDFVRLYDRQDQVAFLDGHVRAFAHFGGVPARIVYDNLAAAVRRVQFPRRQLTERFEALVSHYLYEPCFARPGEGHDKGGVEGRGRGVRLQHLTADSPRRLAGRALGLAAGGGGPPCRAAGVGALRRGAAAAAPRARRRVRGAAGTGGLGEPQCAGARRGGLVLGAEPLGGPAGDGADRHRRTDAALPRRGGRAPPAALRRPPGGLPALPRRAGAQAAGGAAGGAGVGWAELGEPFGRLWTLLEPALGAQEGARTLARLLRSLDEHGERRVREVLEQTLASGTFDELAVQRLLASAQPAAAVTVPETLRGYEVESVSAAVYDRLLAAAAP